VLANHSKVLQANHRQQHQPITAQFYKPIPAQQHQPITAQYYKPIPAYQHQPITAKQHQPITADWGGTLLTADDLMYN